MLWRQRASVTLVSLCMTTALGIALGSYIAVCTRSTQFSTRLLQQDKVRELAQAGIEEALWALSQNNWTSSGPSGATAWVISGADRSVILSYPLTGQGATGQVTVTVANYASTGPTWPSITSAATLTLSSGEAFTKTLQATTGPAPLFGNAIASADSYVSFISGGTVDSWNSDPDNNPATAAVPYSFTAGNPTNYAAVVAGRTNGTHGVVLTQATVRGYLATFGAPVSYSTSGTPPGKVLGPTTPAATNVDTRRIGKSAFVPIDEFTVNLPSTTGPNYGGLIGTVVNLLAALLGNPTADVFKYNGDCLINGVALVGPSLTIDRPIKLIITGNLTITTALLFRGKITILPTGSLEIYVDGDVSIGGDGIDNQTQDPKKCVIFCRSGSTTDSLEYTTSEDFHGVIFSENKPIDIRQNATFYGALLSRQYVRFSSSATAPIFHYDTSLRQTRFTQVTTPYIIRQITEP